MSSTSDSSKSYNSEIVGVDIPYVGRSSRDRNPFEIASLNGNMWTSTDNIVADQAEPGDARHKITFAYLPPIIQGVRRLALSGTANQHTKVERTIKEWERYAHVSFVRITNVLAANIRISFDPDDGNWSLVGAQHLALAGIDEKTMNLGGLKPNGAFADDHERHIILHEFGHSLGFLHEHQSPAREGVLSIEASCQRYTQRGWSEEMVQSQIATQDPLYQIISYSSLDLQSVMMYATSGGEDILAELKHELSDMDKAFMVINYPRTGERKSFVYPREGGEAVEMDDRTWTMDHALDVAGLTEAGWPAERESILTKYANLTAARTLEIRETFGEWTKARRQEERVARAAAAAVAVAAAGMPQDNN